METYQKVCVWHLLVHHYLNPQEARIVQSLRGRTVSLGTNVTLPSTVHSTEMHYWKNTEPELVMFK